MCLFIYSFTDLFIHLFLFVSLLVYSIVYRIIRDRTTCNVNEINDAINAKFTTGYWKNLAYFSLNPHTIDRG
jgi:hypothetical protein